jgi:PAS domain S-box-containing protein
VLASGKRQSCELNFTGETRFCAHLESNCIADTAGDAPRCLVVMTDVNERVQAEHALIEKDKYLRSLADSLTVLIAYLDTELRIQFSNAAHKEWFGRSPEALKNRRIQEVVGEQFGQEIEDYLADVLGGHRVDFESQLTHQQRGGRHVHMMLVPDKGSNGEVQGIHCLALDITERKVVEEQNARRRHFAERLVRLTAAETEVYERVIRGKSNRAIAIELDIGLRTAERRRHVILEKLQVESLAELLQQLADIQGIEPAS